MASLSVDVAAGSSGSEIGGGGSSPGGTLGEAAEIRDALILLIH